VRSRNLTTVLVVAEGRLYADAIVDALGLRGFVAFVASPSEARAAEADVVLVDVSRADSLRLLGRLAAAPGACVVAIGLPVGPSIEFACAEAGAIATVLASASVDELARVVTLAAEGEPVLAPSVVAQLTRRVAALTAARRSASLPSGITRRELQVLELIEGGLSNKEIASNLCVELQTVKNHVHSILRKLDVERRAQAGAAFRAVAGFPGTEVLGALVDRI
jgi:two-component system nitrate/nitrite response regulator NarL